MKLAARAPGVPGEKLFQLVVPGTNRFEIYRIQS